MTVASAVLSIIVSAQHARQEGGEGHGEGRFVAEMVVVESLGAFRNVARLIFLVAATADVER